MYQIGVVKEKELCASQFHLPFLHFLPVEVNVKLVNESNNTQVCLESNFNQ